MAPAGIPARILSFRPLTFVGRISMAYTSGIGRSFWSSTRPEPGSKDGPCLPAAGGYLRLRRLLVVRGGDPVRQKTFASWRSWSWIPVGAVAVAGVLFVTTVDSAAAASNILLNPRPCQTSLHRTSTGPFRPMGTTLRVLVVGDSLSLTVGFWLTPYASHYGVVMRGRPLDGCGLATAFPMMTTAR